MAYDITLLWDFLSAFAPPARMSPADWARANIVLPSTSNAEPGPLRLTSYQAGLLNAFADQEAETLVFQLASQTGKSITIDAAMLYSIALDPGPLLHVSPTEGKAVDFMRDRLLPLIKSTPAVAALINERSNSRLAFEGGSLNTASSFKPDDLAARAIRILFADEIDRFAQSAGTEGDPISLAIKRTHTFRNRKIVLSSTPTAKGASRINDWFLRGTQERFYVPCPECGTCEPLRFDNVKWTPRQPETARYACEHCGHHLSDRERLAAVDDGKWTITNQNAEARIRSFHATQLVSKFATMEEIVAEFEAADTPEKRRVFTNVTLGDVFDYQTEAGNDATDLQSRAVAINAPYPKEIDFITAGTDVQGNRTETTFLAHVKGGPSYVLDHVTCHGDTSGNEPWIKLHDVLGTPFTLQDGRVIALSMSFVDGGFLTSRVADFVALQRQRQRRAHIIFGRAGWDKPTVKESARIQGKLKGVVVGVDNVKLNVVKMLASGGIILPNHLDSNYFEQLSAERLEARNVRGFTKLEWGKTAGARNEALDCLGYAYAAGTLVNGRAKSINEKSKIKSIGEAAAKLHAISNTSGGTHVH